MALTWKDLVTTILAASIFGIYYAMTKGIDLPIISGYRSAILVLGVLGMIMCAMSGSGSLASGMNFYAVVGSIFGVLSLILIVYGLITGAKIAFTILTFVIIGLWVFTTIHHIIGN